MDAMKIFMDEIEKVAVTYKGPSHSANLRLYARGLRHIFPSEGALRPTFGESSATAESIHPLQCARLPSVDTRIGPWFSAPRGESPLGQMQSMLKKFRSGKG